MKISDEMKKMACERISANIVETRCAFERLKRYEVQSPDGDFHGSVLDTVEKALQQLNRMDAEVDSISGTFF